MLQKYLKYQYHLLREINLIPRYILIIGKNYIYLKKIYKLIKLNN